MTVLAIVGPTASGKSALAYDIACERIADGFPTEIVAVDAFTLYRSMNIATAKPSPQARQNVPHHLIDILDPHEEISVAIFQERARGAIQEIHARGATPLLVGGSGLYWRAVVDALEFPPTDRGVRDAIGARWENDPHGAHALLIDRDPEAAARIEPENLRRIVRALEVMELTGRRFSEFRAAWDRYESVYPSLRVAYLDLDDTKLRTAIDERAQRMVDDGLLDEAAALVQTRLSRTARQAIGYAEAFAVLDGTANEDELAAAIAARTWRYARRQRAWFRADPRCHPQDPASIRAAFTAAVA